MIETLLSLYMEQCDVIAMTDQNKEVVAAYEYDAWGVLIGESGWSFCAVYSYYNNRWI
ncbi:hypothetical protein ABH955_002819 [Bacillus sp. RC240]|uniref:hypothetical protein n=1 Tax=unclassified Bacillus (in: firmicutes) TaxID=185979 RepID=UPI0015F074D0|nr:hypothetical protein [Bacillus sp. DB-2]